MIASSNAGQGKVEKCRESLWRHPLEGHDRESADVLRDPASRSFRGAFLGLSRGNGSSSCPGSGQDRHRPGPLAGRRAAAEAGDAGLDRLRFVTDSDYPPFHYFDEEGALTGFNVDMARAICEALAVDCEVRPVYWDDLFTKLDAGEADAAIASIRIDADALTKADLRSVIMRHPAASSRAKRTSFATSAPRRWTA